MEKLVYGGEALARVEGRVWLTPYALPGETVRVEPVEAKPQLVRGRLIEVRQPSAARVAAPCPYFGVCGGCAYQHAEYGYQLEQKAEILREVLRRVGKLEAPEPVRVLSGPPYEYRNRSQFHLRQGRLGYLEAGSHRLLDVELCPISSPRLNEALRALRGMMRRPRFPHFIEVIELFTNEAEVQVNVLETSRPVARHFFEWCAREIPGFAPGAIDYAAGGETYRVSPRSFFQVNRFLIDTLADEALTGERGARALDLYAGVGLFALRLGERFDEVTAVESGASAVEDLRLNAARKGVDLRIAKASAEQFLAGLEAPPDFVLADPPRAGLGRDAVRELLRLRPPRLTIVACDPATLARDLQRLAGGGYRLDAVTVIDLFPQTHHLETVAKLSLP
ncbi:MAG: class I SAM-dependent RNA methyltransferase [Acidobacteria bacterium]|nr:class I SAM-dependent RNA methyltransferase [Acidobacteriota bacterium]